MSKKNVLIITTSLRSLSNSTALAYCFGAGATDAGHKVEEVSLRQKKIAFCQGCFKCEKNHKCVIKDDASKIVDKMFKADVLVFATPIYYYEMAGQMKTLLDRANPLYDSNYKFRKVYMISTATDTNKTTAKRAIEGLKGWVSCFPKAKFENSLFCGGVTKEGDVEHNKKLKEAYAMGKKV